MPTFHHNITMWGIKMLNEEIEVLRTILYNAISENDSEWILKVSKKLDELIVKYYEHDNNAMPC
jgi:hypothetical protein